MGALRPFRGVRYSGEQVKLGGVLAPPYDVITPAQRETLYGRDLRNIVRVDFGIEYPDDVAGDNDRYTRAAGFLESWCELGILVQDPEPSFYVVDHEFRNVVGERQHRQGILAVLPARPWEQSPLRPHERTLSAPKEDRLALLRATCMQTSPVFVLSEGANDVAAFIDAAAQGRALLGGRIEGEVDSEKLLLWRVDHPDAVAKIQGGFERARLYVADGHHRYETAVAYAAERRAQEPDAPFGADFEMCLVYVVDAGDPALSILPTHRLLRPASGLAFSLDDLWARVDDAWDARAVASVQAGYAAAAEIREDSHAFVVCAAEGAALLHRRRVPAVSPRENLDVSVLEREVLEPAGLTAESITAGALGYTRSLSELEEAVHQRRAVLGFAVQPLRPYEVMAVADAGETMPQKSTYFYPKVPTGLVLHSV